MKEKVHVYPENLEINVNRILFDGKELKLFHEKPCTIKRITTSKGEKHSVRLVLEDESVINFSLSSILSTKATTRKLAFEFCPIASSRFSDFFGAQWNQYYKTSLMIIEVENCYVLEKHVNDKRPEKKIRKNYLKFEALLNYIRSWEDEYHGSAMHLVPPEKVCCCGNSINRIFFQNLTAEEFDNYFAFERELFNDDSIDSSVIAGKKMQELKIAPTGKEKSDLYVGSVDSSILTSSTTENILIKSQQEDGENRKCSLIPEIARYKGVPNHAIGSQGLSNLNGDNRKSPHICETKLPNILSRSKQPVNPSPIPVTCIDIDNEDAQIVEIGDETSSNRDKEPSPDLNKLTITDTEYTLLCRYPDKGNIVNVTFRDMSRLPYGEMLNDVNIEFGIQYILHSKAQPKFIDSCHVFNTFFWQNLVTIKENQIVNLSNATSRKAWIKSNFPKVMNWTKKFNLFSKDHIIVPINADLHWCILIIQNPRASLVDKSKKTEKCTESCLYIMLDSIPDSDEKRNHGVDIIRDYLELEFQDKLQETNPNLIFDPSRVKKVSHKYNPIQKNFIDCGVYLLAFFQQYTEEEPKVDEDYMIDWIKYCPFFELTKVKYLREKMVNFIRQHTTSERWSRLRRYEEQNGGITNPSIESRAIAARKTRSHSYSQADFDQQEREFETRRQKERRERCRSVPARFDILLSTKPLVVCREENGKITAKIN